MAFATELRAQIQVSISLYLRDPKMHNYEDSQFEFEFPDHHHQASSSDPPLTCSQGHRSSLVLGTVEGGSICLLCFSNLISDPHSPTFHVSYALSQLSHALSQPSFLQSLLSFHVHIVLSPLVQSLSCFDDEQIAHQVLDLILQLCVAEDSSVLGEFVARVSDRLSLAHGLPWSRHQVHMLHCLGVLLNNQTYNPYDHIKDKDKLIHNLITALNFPSEEIRGEVLFVLYRISILQCATEDGADILYVYGPKLLRLTMEVILKTQRDEVHLNSIALLKVMAQREFFTNAFSTGSCAMSISMDENSMQVTNGEVDSGSLTALFTEAIKTPLLSPDSQVQIAALDLIHHCLSREGISVSQIQVLVEENIVDYVFEILRLSELKYDLLSSCLRVLYLLSTAEQVFQQRLAIGFATLVSTLPHVAEVPFHPVQAEMLKLVLLGVISCPGVLSSKHIEDISSALTAMLRKHVNGETGMLPEAFNVACSILVALMKSPSGGTANLVTSVQQASRHVVLASLSIYEKYPGQLLHSLYLVKEAYQLDHKMNPKNNSTCMRNCIIELCEQNIIPWFVKAIYDIEEEGVLGVLETLHSILENNDARILEFTKSLLSFSWFHLLFECLGLFPSERIKWRVYLMLSSIVDNLLGNGFGRSIKEAASSLPIDPMDLLFLLGQKRTHNQELSSCQSAVVQILYICSLYNEMFADNKLILTSLEQYILVNHSDLLYGYTDSFSQLVFLYGHYRGLAHVIGNSSHSQEAEKIFFSLVHERDWELSFAGNHPTSLKWLFQQEKVIDKLSLQILNFCRSISAQSGTTFHVPNRNEFIGNIAELVVAGDNYAPELFVILLSQLVEEENQADNVGLLINLITSIIYVNATASDQLCKHRICTTLQTLCHRSFYMYSTETRTIVLHFIFVILSNAHPEALFDNESWLGVTMKMLVSLRSAANVKDWSNDYVLVIGIVSLILHHSTQKVLVQTSKSILLNSSLVSMIQNTCGGESMAGLCLSNQEARETAMPLVFLLLLSCFYLKSLRAVFPEYAADGQPFLTPYNGTLPFPEMSILCQGYCRLMYHGSLLVKIIASYCLVELFKEISDTGHRNQMQIDFKINMGSFRSVTAVLEGLVFHDDLRVAVNSAKCLAEILSWLIPRQQKLGPMRYKWSRMIVEELAMSLGAPNLVSKAFSKHHKSAIHVAIAILNLSDLPGWMKSVFDGPCVSAIIQNLTPCNVSVELVKFFRGLLCSGILKADHIASLNYTFQECRKELLYMNCGQDKCKKEKTRKTTITSGDSEEVCEFLLNLIDTNSKDIQDVISILSEELELFFKSVAETDVA